MSRKGKETLEYLQLKELLPASIYDKLPCYLLKEVGFSLADDKLSRSKKFIKLALITKSYGQDNNYTTKWLQEHLELEELDDETINQVVYESYQLAAEFLKLNEPMVGGFEKLDYYTSLAQQQLWAVHALLSYDPSQHEKALGLLFECYNSLKAAQVALNEFPSGTEVTHRIEILANLVKSRVLQLPDDLLKQMAADQTTELMLAEQSDLEKICHNIVENKMSEARKTIELQSQLSPAMKEKTLERFRALKLEKIASFMGLKTRQEKISIILAQSLQVNWNSLKRIKSVTEEDKALVEELGLLSYAYLLDNYRFIIAYDHEKSDAEKIESVRNKFGRTIQDLYVSRARHLQAVKDLIEFSR